MTFNFDKLCQQSKRIPTLAEYAACLLPLENPEDNAPINQWGMVAGTNPNALKPVKVSEHGFRFMPAAEFSPRIYRGENEYHPVCVPNLYRTGTRPVDALFWQAKGYELSLLLNHHPAVIDLRETLIEGLPYGFVTESIAQHYQYKTTLMDFSQSKDVAMFFATCQCNTNDGTYTPLHSGTASLYTADLASLIKERHADAGFIPLGFEPLPRPEAQKALAIRLKPGENLNQMPWITRVDIAITPQLSEHYFSMFDGGAKLMPHNPFDEEIRRLANNNALAPETVAFAIAENLLPQHPKGLAGATAEFTGAGYTIKAPSTLPDEAVITAAQKDWNERKTAFYNNIESRGHADHVIIT